MQGYLKVSAEGHKGTGGGKFEYRGGSTGLARGDVGGRLNAQG